MSRTVLLDPGVDLAKIEGSGLLIGSHLPTHLLAVYAAPTPEEAEEVEEGKGDQEKKLDVPWILEHAKQVLRSLPGGVHVVGVVFNSSPDILDKADSKIRKLLVGLKGLDVDIDEEVVFLVAQGMKGRVLVGDQLTNIEAKVAEQSIEFVQLDSTLILDIPVAHYCDKQSNMMLHSHALKAVRKFERTLMSSLCLFDSQLKSKDDLICPPQFETKRKGKGKARETLEAEDEAETDPIKYTVSVLVQDDPNVRDDVLIEKNNIRLKLSGKLKSRSFVPHGSTVSQCKSAVLSDVMRSLRCRIQLHCDSLVGEEKEGGDTGAGPIVHEPPRRIFTPLPGTQLCISDYLYPGEGGEDSLESIKEIFGYTPLEEDIEDDLEIVAAAKDVRMKREEDEEQATGVKKRLRLGYIAACVGFAALSALLAWKRFRGSTTEEEEGEGEHQEL